MFLGIFASLWRWIKVWGYRVTGRIDKARELASMDPAAINAQMDEILAKSARDINDLGDAIAEIIRLQEEARGELGRVQAKLNDRLIIQRAARGKIEARIRELQGNGVTGDAIKVDPEFMRHNKAFSTVSTEITSLQADVARLNANVSDKQTKLDGYKAQLMQMKRVHDGRKQKKASLAARAIIAQQEERLNKMLSGLTQDDTTAQMEADLEAGVNRLEAKAKVSATLAETDTALADAEYREYAATDAAATEFDTLIYAADRVETKAKGDADKDAATDKQTDSLV